MADLQLDGVEARRRQVRRGGDEVLAHALHVGRVHRLGRLADRRVGQSRRAEQRPSRGQRPALVAEVGHLCAGLRAASWTASTIRRYAGTVRGSEDSTSGAASIPSRETTEDSRHTSPTPPRARAA